MRKVIRTMPRLYRPKLYSIEESHIMDTYTLDQIYRSISTFEIWEFEDHHNVKKKFVFKSTNKIDDVLETINDLYDEEEKIVRRLKRGSIKYKGKLPLKFFNCRRIGHYATRCTFNEDNYNRPSDDNKRKGKYIRDENNKIIDDREKPKMKKIVMAQMVNYYF